MLYVHFEPNSITSGTFEFTALIELPESIEPNTFVRPVNLATACTPSAEVDEHVIVIGKGGTEANVTDYSHIWDKRIRFADFGLMPTEKCLKETELDAQLAEPASVICTHTKAGRSAFRGDSGNFLFGNQTNVIDFIEDKVIHFIEDKVTLLKAN